MGEQLVDVTVTADDREWLARWVYQLVEDRLAACGNIVPGIRSIYRWEGRTHDDPQALATLHTRASLVPAIIERANVDHPDTTPQVLAVPVLDAHPGYRQWVIDSTT